MSKKRGNRPYMPTAEEIAAACQEIREHWTPEEEQRRRVVQWEQIWQLPIIDDSELDWPPDDLPRLDANGKIA